jgi:hypothetical protein
LILGFDFSARRATQDQVQKRRARAPAPHF